MVENRELNMLDPRAIVTGLETVGFTHLVWIPDSHLGTWESALEKSCLAPIRVTREGEAIGLAAGLMLGGARPLVAMQCTGFFEAGDALRNVAHDLKLPLKMIVGVRSWTAHSLGKSSDNCPRFAEKLIQAWDIPHSLFDPTGSTPEQLAVVLRGLVGHPGPAAILWAE
jgi:sulfopyruvate decarboxylase TPP-binding subunit